MAPKRQRPEATPADEDDTSRSIADLKEDVKVAEAYLRMLMKRKEEMKERLADARRRKEEYEQDRETWTRKKRRLEAAREKHIQLQKSMESMLSKAEYYLERLSSPEVYTPPEPADDAVSFTYSDSDEAYEEEAAVVSDSTQDAGEQSLGKKTSVESVDA